MSESDDRRQRRAAGQSRLDSIAADYIGRPDVDRTRMFGSECLRRHGKIFAFVDADGGLVVKIPADGAGELIAAGTATAVRIGRNEAREWVSTPPSPDGDLRPWQNLVEAAYQYAPQQ